MLTKVIVLVLSVGVGLGQQVLDQGQTNWNERIQQLSFMNRGQAEYRMGPGDLLEVSIYGLEDFKYSLRINSRGEITLPFVGTIEAAGLTPGELERHLKTRFEAGLIKEPQISVFVREYRSQVVFVLGAVKQPGQYQMIHQLNLVDVLAMAGGVVPEKAGDEAIVQRRGRNDVSPQRIDLRALLDDGRVSLNVPIEGGDVIHVPERKLEFFYVVGEVQKPGAFEIPPENDVLVSQAVTWAGGPMRTAKANNGLLVRYDGNGGRQELAVNFEQIIKGKRPDFLIQPNDVIFIPGSTFKTLGYGLLQVVPHTVSGAVIWGPLSGRY